MNNKIIWVIGGIIIILLVIVIAKPGSNKDTTTVEGEKVTTGTAGEVSNKSGTPTGTVKAPAKTTKTGTSPSSVMTTNKTTLKAIMARGGSEKCTVNDITNAGSVTGTAFVSAGRVRVDYLVSSTNGPSNAHMLLISPDVYVWKDGMTTGNKTNTSASTLIAAKPEVDGLSIDKALDYKCETWSTDPSKFVLPGSVTFTKAS